MTSALESRLDRITSEQLLAAIGSDPADQAEQPEAAEHDWHRPQCLSGEQLSRLEAFVVEVAGVIGTKFERFCNAATNVTVSSSTLHFAGELLRELSESKDSYLAFGRDPQGPTAFLGVPPETAAAWTQLVLGESEPQGQPEAGLSTLEQSLLLDISNAVVDSLTRALAQQDAQQGQMRSSGLLVTGPPPVQFEKSLEVCKINLEIEVPDTAKSQAYFVIPCDELISVAGYDAQGRSGSDQQDNSAVLLEHLKSMTVSVTARLISTSLSFGQVMNLDCDDIVLLDKTLDEPVDLIIEGRTAFQGRLAKSEGHLAVALTGPSVAATRHVAEPVLVN